MTQSSTFSADFELFQTYLLTNKNGIDIPTEYNINGKEKKFNDLKPDDVYSFIKSDKFVQVTGFTPEQNHYLNKHKDKMYFDQYGHICIYDSSTGKVEYFKNTFDPVDSVVSNNTIPNSRFKLKFNDKKQTHVFLSPLQNKYFLLYGDDDEKYSFEIYLNPLTENLPKYLENTNNMKLLRDYCYMFPTSNICSCLQTKDEKLKENPLEEDIDYCTTMAKSIADGTIKTDTYGWYQRKTSPTPVPVDSGEKIEKEIIKDEIEEVQGIDWYWLILIELIIILLIGGGSYLYFSKT